MTVKEMAEEIFIRTAAAERSPSRDSLEYDACTAFQYATAFDKYSREHDDPNEENQS